MKKMFLVALMAFGVVSISSGLCFDNAKRACIQTRECEKLSGEAKEQCETNCAGLANAQCKKLQS